MTERCSGCGLEIADANASCQALFDELIARDFSDPRYGRTHRLAVDVYCLQHPDRYCASAKSLAAHLVGLRWILEEHGDTAISSESLRRWLDGNRRLQKPELPAFRGILTIADVLGADTPEAHAAAVQRWAESTWAAYATLHELAREWGQQATENWGRLNE